MLWKLIENDENHFLAVSKVVTISPKPDYGICVLLEKNLQPLSFFAMNFAEVTKSTTYIMCPLTHPKYGFGKFSSDPQYDPILFYITLHGIW